MSRLVLAHPRDARLAARLAAALGAEERVVEARSFPDGETYLRIDTPCAGRDVVVTGSLARPDPAFLPLAFLADAARDLGASRVVLAVPYLAYMRQDTRFRPGEAITSRTFARLVSSTFDSLVTVDPHLHRYRELGEIYSIPTRVVKAAPLLAAWIRENVKAPVLAGPDEESGQWVSDVAERAGAPHFVLEKTRRGDRDVEVSPAEAGRWHGRTPVLVDDIVSTANTMIAAVRQLAAAGLPGAICLGVHAVFADGAHEQLLAAGASRVVTTDTIEHPTNAVSVIPSLAAAIGSF